MSARAPGRRLAVISTLAVAVLATPSAADAHPAGHHGHHQHHQHHDRHRHLSELSMRDRKIHHGLEVAIRHKGDPYHYGSAGPGAFDCSGLTMYSFAKAGLHLPRSSDGQAHAVRHIPKKNLHRGDFVFFTSGRHVYHVAIYLGRHDGQRFILHAPYSGTVVQRDPIWTSSWFAGTLRHKH